MLNSAHLVWFPSRSPSPLTWPIGALVNPPPNAPPITLKPLICSATSGNVAKSRPTLVTAPVATSHAVFLGHASSAFRIATIGLTLVVKEKDGSGRRPVPSRPETPLEN